MYKRLFHQVRKSMTLVLSFEVNTSKEDGTGADLRNRSAYTGLILFKFELRLCTCKTSPALQRKRQEFHFLDIRFM